MKIIDIMFYIDCSLCILMFIKKIFVFTNNNDLLNLFIKIVLLFVLDIYKNIEFIFENMFYVENFFLLKEV